MDASEPRLQQLRVQVGVAAAAALVLRAVVARHRQRHGRRRRLRLHRQRHRRAARRLRGGLLLSLQRNCAQCQSSFVMWLVVFVEYCTLKAADLRANESFPEGLYQPK